jgi:hypothetical protein
LQGKYCAAKQVRHLVRKNNIAFELGFLGFEGYLGLIFSETCGKFQTCRKLYVLQIGLIFSETCGKFQTCRKLYVLQIGLIFSETCGKFQTCRKWYTLKINPKYPSNPKHPNSNIIPTVVRRGMTLKHWESIF